MVATMSWNEISFSFDTGYVNTRMDEKTVCERRERMLVIYIQRRRVGFSTREWLVGRFGRSERKRLRRPAGRPPSIPVLARDFGFNGSNGNATVHTKTVQMSGRLRRIQGKVKGRPYAAVRPDKRLYHGELTESTTRIGGVEQAPVRRGYPDNRRWLGDGLSIWISIIRIETISEPSDSRQKGGSSGLSAACGWYFRGMLAMDE